ncbi:hypothetical protein ACHAP8_011330 [Fusarium lateritium]
MSRRNDQYVRQHTERTHRVAANEHRTESRDTGDENSQPDTAFVILVVLADVGAYPGGNIQAGD